MASSTVQCVEQARHLVAQLCALPSEQLNLLVIADELRTLAISTIWDIAPYREAIAGEELLYQLAVRPGSPSLYLVSDGAGVESPPHSHETWAIIAGIRGRELNRRYAMRGTEGRTVVQIEEVEVRPGEALVLRAPDIHSNAVMGNASTFHLHLYGRPLNELPDLSSRCYIAGP
jgi:hypothetical protein